MLLCIRRIPSYQGISKKKLTHACRTKIRTYLYRYLASYDVGCWKVTEAITITIKWKCKVPAKVEVDTIDMHIQDNLRDNLGQERPFSLSYKIDFNNKMTREWEDFMTPPFILASIAMDGIMIIPFTKVNVYVKTYMYMYMYVHIGLSLYLVFLSMVCCDH